MATLGYTFTVYGQDEEAFLVVGYEGQESISDSVMQSGAPCFGFRYHLELASRDDTLKPENIVDKTGLLTVWRNGEPVQYVHGVVRRFSLGDIGHHHTFYKLTLVSSLERLSLRHNSRIFQTKTVQEIISSLLDEMQITAYSFSLKRTLAQREFCVQYRESDLEFVHRLAAEEGIVYYVKHEKGKHTIVFTDDTSKLKKSTEVPYNGLSGGAIDTTYVSAVHVDYQSESSSVVMQDYSFKKPSYGFLQQQKGQNLDHQQAIYEHYDFPGRYKDDTSGKAFSEYRMEYLRRDAISGHGESNEPKLQAGVKFALTDHLQDSMNREWLVTVVTHQGSQPQALEEEAGSGATTYANQFQCVPGTTLWRAAPQPKPQVDGPMIAKVVGPAGEEIFCDKDGRVKVHFPWDRESQQNEKSSCWVRVSQGWAGGQYGFIAIPRIGHEVIVSFLNGDPDQPIITGRTYHATNVAPYVLPNHKTRTVLKTQTHKGDGSNEIRFEDEASIEQIYIHAQKDQDIVTNNIHRESVGVDQHTRIGRHKYEMITENEHRLVGKNVTEEYGQDHHQKVGRNIVQRVLGKVSRYITGGVINKIDGSSVTQVAASEEKEIGANQRIKVNNESYLNAKTVVLEANSSLTIKGPGGFVKIDSGGVTISGTKVKINEGGSPDTGTAPTMVTPDDTDKPQEPDKPDQRG